MKQACQALAVPRATWYRRRRLRLFPVVASPEKLRRHAARALSENEQSAVLACLHKERFQDCSPAQVYAALLDEGRFHCSIRTMYRLLETHGKVANAVIMLELLILRPRLSGGKPRAQFVLMP